MPHHCCDALPQALQCAFGGEPIPPAELAVDTSTQDSFILSFRTPLGFTQGVFMCSCFPTMPLLH